MPENLARLMQTESVIEREGRLQSIAGHVRSILQLIGEDTEREGLKDTPKRVAKAYLEMFSGLDPRNEPNVTLFKNSEGYNEMVCETNLEFHTVCEHHLLPFFGVVHMGYIPRKNGKYVGLSKLGRIVDYYAHRPQVQERLTCLLANWLQEKLRPEGAIVVIEAEHLCMSARGVKKPRHLTITSAIRGDIDKDEFLRLVRGSKPHQ